MRGCDYYMFIKILLSFISLYCKILIKKDTLSIETEYINIIKDCTESHNLASKSTGKISLPRIVFSYMISVIDVIFCKNNLFGFIFCFVNKRTSLNTFIFVH